MPPPSLAVWDEQYRSGAYRSRWDYTRPPAELVGALVCLDLPEGAAVLDVGCGAGAEAVFLAGQGFRAIGVDISPEALSIARERAAEAGVDVDWRLGTAVSLPVADGEVDLASDRGCFHHVGRDERQRFADEIYRVLRPGGSLLLRGSRHDARNHTRVDAGEVDAYFDRDRFSRGPLLPVVLHSDAKTLEANMVLLSKRSD